MLRVYDKLCRIEENWGDGEAYLQQSLELNRTFGESVSLAETLYELGILQRESGNFSGGIRCPARGGRHFFYHRGHSRFAADARRARRTPILLRKDSRCT